MRGVGSGKSGVLKAGVRPARVFGKFGPGDRARGAVGAPSRGRQLQGGTAGDDRGSGRDLHGMRQRVVRLGAAGGQQHQQCGKQRGT